MTAVENTKHGLKICARIRDLDEGEFSIVDIAPTLLRYLEKREGPQKGRLEAGVLGTDIKINTFYDIQRLGYCGASLEDVIEDRLHVNLESFNHIIIYLIDGMGFATFFKSGKPFFEKIKPEIASMFTTFPSMTTVATTSLFTGAFPIEHKVFADRFWDVDTGERFNVKPNLSDNTKLLLPSVVPITTYFLLSSLMDKDGALGFITAGKSHSQSEGRRFLDHFFGSELFRETYVKTTGNLETSQEAEKYIKRNETKKFWLLFVRFTIDRLAHMYGADNPIVTSELYKIFQYIISLDSKLKESGSGQTLSFIVSDHGHKPVPEGFVPFSKFEKYLGKNYKFYATNQTILNLYSEDLHPLIMKSDIEPALVRVKKEGSGFYGYDWAGEKWKTLKPGALERFATAEITGESYGTDFHIGEVVVHFENCYLGGLDLSNYHSGFTHFKSSHGGLSYQEVYVPGFFWST